MALLHDVLMLVLGAGVGEAVRAVFKIAGRSDEKEEARHEARDVVARHLKRMSAQIDGLDTYIRFAQTPGLEHVRMVRRILQEREQMDRNIAGIGDPALESAVRGWFQTTDNALHFAEDYVSGDRDAPGRYGVDLGEWERRWGQQYNLHARQIMEAARLAEALVSPKTKPKTRKPKVPPDAMLIRGR